MRILLACFIFTVLANNMLLGVSFTTVHFPGSLGTDALGINDAGHVVGQHNDPIDLEGPPKAFVFDGTTYTDIVIPGGDAIHAADINTNGIIVGLLETDIGRRGYRTDGINHVIFDFVGPGTTQINTDPQGINDLGQIFGQSETRGFLIDGSVHTHVEVPGKTVSGATGINSDGVIVGWVGGGIDPGEGFLQDGATSTIIEFPGISFANPQGAPTGATSFASVCICGRKYHEVSRSSPVISLPWMDPERSASTASAARSSCGSRTRTICARRWS